MPTGLRVPVGVNKSGGANIETNEPEQVRKLLFLALSEGGDDNPFQALGLQGDLIFSIRNASFRGKAQRYIDRVLAKFADRVALAPDQPITFEDIGDAEVEVSFSYIDLATNRVEEFRSKFAKQTVRRA